MKKLFAASLLLLASFVSPVAYAYPPEPKCPQPQPPHPPSVQSVLASASLELAD